MYIRNWPPRVITSLLLVLGAFLNLYLSQVHQCVTPGGWVVRFGWLFGWLGLPRVGRVVSVFLLYVPLVSLFFVPSVFVLLLRGFAGVYSSNGLWKRERARGVRFLDRIRLAFSWLREKKRRRPRRSDRFWGGQVLV